jgi:hypothetical protein
MKIKTREEDRRAMDLLLDRTSIASGAVPVYAAVDGRLRERVAEVGKVLEVLENIESPEPPRNLVSRTLRFIESATGETLHRPRHAHPGHYSAQSHPA